MKYTNVEEIDTYFDLEKSYDPDVNIEAPRYIAGYLAVLYLGELAAGRMGLGSALRTDPETGLMSVDSATLRMGLNEILTSLHAGNTLNGVIREISEGRYADAADFERRFLKGDGTRDKPSLSFVVSFRNYMRDLEAEADFYKIDRSSEYVQSTADYWRGGGTSHSGNPDYNPAPQAYRDAA